MAEKTNRFGISGKQWGIFVAVCCMYFFAPMFGAVSVTFGEMPAVFGISNAAASWISSIGNACSCIAGLLVGLFVGKKVSYRAGAIIATFGYTIFGALPWLMPNISWGMLLCTRALYGLAMGMFNPIVQSIITRMVTNETARAAMIGVINIIFSIGASCGNIIAGAFALRGWNWAYMLYAFCIVPAILVLIFVHDKNIVHYDDIVGDDIAAAAEGTAEKASIPVGAWLFILVFALCTLCTQTFFNYTPIAMAVSGANTLLIGTVFTVFTVAGIVIAAANAAMWKLLRLWNYPLSYLLIGAAYIFCLLGFNSGSTAMFFLASIVMGVGCCLCGMVMPMAMSTMVPVAALTMAISFQEIARNLGSFLSSPWLVGIGKAFGDTPAPQFTAIMILAFVATILAALLAIKYNKRFKNVEMEEK